MNSITSNNELKPSTQRRNAVAGCSLKIVLAGLWLVLASAAPVPAQTTNGGDDGTVLKAILFFGRHSIRASTDAPGTLDQYSADPYPAFTVAPGLLTPNGQQAAGLLGSYFRDYLLHEGLLTGDRDTDLARSYFRANTIERSYRTAAKFGAGLIPGGFMPVHTYPANWPDPVFEPVFAQIAAIDPARAVQEVQAEYGSGSHLASAYSNELSLISKVLYPPGTQPVTNASQGSVDPTTLPIIITSTAPLALTTNNWQNDFNCKGEVVCGKAVNNLRILLATFYNFEYSPFGKPELPKEPEFVREKAELIEHTN